MPKNEKVLVLLSGGQDSGTTLFWAKQKFVEVGAIAFDYGQRHRVELECAANLAEIADVPLTVKILGDDILDGSALVGTKGSVDTEHPLNPELPASWVPMRNALFFTVAANHAYVNGYDALASGVCQTDYSGYPDCRASFVTAFSEMANEATERRLPVHTPLMFLTKAETWKLAAELGVVDMIVEYTHTDYNGDHETRNEWGYGKLDNPASRLRAAGYTEARERGWI